MSKKLLLIDGHSILNRAFYGLPILTNARGVHTNAIYGFLNIVFKTLDDEQADYIAVAFDLKKPTFRHKAYEQYKGTRKSMPEELREQVPIMKDVLHAMNIPIFSMEGFEADDILGSLAKKYASEQLQVVILSGDRDLLQLADDNIKIKIPKSVKGKTQVIDYFPADVKKDYGVSPKEFIDYKALVGDPSDNIPGVKGIGEKSAFKILSEYHTIEEAYQNVNNIKPKKAAQSLKDEYEEALFYKFLVTIKTDVDIDSNLENMTISDMFNEKSLSLINDLEFSSLLDRFDKKVISDSNFKNIGKINYKYVNNILDIDNIELTDEIGLDLINQKVVNDKDKVQNNVVAISICTSNLNAYTIACDNLKDILLKVINRVKLVYTFNLKDIIKFLGCENYLSIKDCKFYDISIAAYLINPLKDNYKMSNVANEYLNLFVEAYDDVFKKKDIVVELENNNIQALECCCNFSIVSINASKIILEKLSNLGMDKLYFDIELPLIYTLANMEENGILVDRNRLREYSLELDDIINNLSEEIYKEAGQEFNINSQKQLGVILFEELGIKGGKKTKTGYSTSADLLEKLKNEHIIIDKILEYRKLTKLNSTYLKGLQPYIEDDGRIRTTFNQTITATGRISSTEPNLQNIPIRSKEGMKIRDVFVAKNGYSFVDADYSQIELRILAVLSKDEKLIDSYKLGKDIHRITAAKVFNVPIDEVSDIQRRNAKAVNFGVVYGISAFGLSEDLSISRQEAKEYINNYFATYDKVKEYLDDCVKEAKLHGYTKTMFGRRRPIPEISSSNFMVRSFGDRIAMNSPIQGSAADIMKLAMIKTEQALREKKYDAKIVLQVHDELLIECKDEIAKEVKALVVDVMKNVVDLSVTLEVEANIGKTWLESK